MQGGRGDESMNAGAGGQSTRFGPDRLVPKLAVVLGFAMLVLLGLGFVWAYVDLKGSFSMTLLPPVIASVFVLAVSILALALFCVLRGRRSSALSSPCVLAMAGLLFCLVMLPSYLSAREGAALVQETGFVVALRSYIEEHDGDLPGSFDDLLDGGYVGKTGDGEWVVYREEDESRPGCGILPGSTWRGVLTFE